MCWFRYASLVKNMFQCDENLPRRVCVQRLDVDTNPLTESKSSPYPKTLSLSQVVALQGGLVEKSCFATKNAIEISGIPKLDDANNAGTKNSLNCTLILTEGDSAKTLAISGLSVVGRDNYGVFPLRGKVLNVRDANHKQVS